MQKARRCYSSKMLFRSAILLIPVLGFGCSAIWASTIKDTCSGKGSLYGYTSMINLNQQDSMYVRLSNDKAAYMLPINNIPTEYKREFSKENIDADTYELHLVKKGVMKNCGNVEIKADSTALLQIVDPYALEFVEMKEKNISTKIHYTEKRSFKERGTIEGKITDPSHPDSYGVRINISQFPFWRASVDSTGYFRIDNILPGTYDLSILPIDIPYNASTYRNIKVKDKEISNIKITLYSTWIQPIENPNKPRQMNKKKAESND